LPEQSLAVFQLKIHLPEQSLAEKQLNYDVEMTRISFLGRKIKWEKAKRAGKGVVLHLLVLLKQFQSP
jgi:hypothetical protein